ncbi:MAG: cell division protein FtsW [Treponema sp.]|nr:cell division protein FtsW [Treponema sp.]MBR4629198.1 cell division protein FtsW [Treponema sp.]MBR6913063.1 cell division protein FtsW [Treponema sp.]MCR5125216.1 putative lipid II flippase FtsW [Treponema sp.]
MNFNFFTDKPLEKYRKSDPLIFVSMILLCGLGILALYFCSRNKGIELKSDSLYFVKRQLICLFLGFIAFLTFVSMSMGTIKKILPIIVVGSVVMCILTFIPFFGVNANGARRWLRIPFVGTFQPSELVKLSLVLYLANFFDKMSLLKKKQKNVFPAVLCLVIFFAIVLMQQDFSTSFFILFLGISMFVVSGEKVRWIWPLFAILIPVAIISIMMNEYRLNRIIGFFDQTRFAQDQNYQLVNAKKAIMAGGFWGQGFGSGLTKINSVPEVQTDYIFAGWAEATGLFGVLAYFSLLAFFAWRVLRCALTTSDRFASLGTFGFLLAIVGQSLMNVAVVVGVLPTTGVPLPFFSSGGTSIIVTMTMCGFVVSASRLDSVENSLYMREQSEESFSGVGHKKSFDSDDI